MNGILGMLLFIFGMSGCVFYLMSKDKEITWKQNDIYEGLYLLLFLVVLVVIGVLNIRLK